VRDTFRRFVGARSGATSIEYAIIAGGIAMAIILVVQTLGTTLNTRYQDVDTALASQNK